MTQPVLPQPLPGFAHVNRYWDKRLDTPAAKILPGQFYVSDKGEMISTVLGSCISACIRDKRRGIGGMNHFMLPSTGDHSSWDKSEVSSAARYGNWAMEYLINAIIKAGGNKKDFEVKLFGGGKVMANMDTDIGKRNIEFAREFIALEGFTVDAEDVGGPFPRKVLYFPDTGSVKLKRMAKVHNDTVKKREEQYSKTLEVKPAEGEVDLF